MKDSYLSAKLVKEDTIRLVVFSSLPWSKIEPWLVVDGVKTKILHPFKMSSMPSLAMIDYKLDKPLELGHSYNLEIYGRGCLGVDVSEATTFPGFDEKYYYDGDDLGATYSKEQTTFALWAPLASRVQLAYRDHKGDHFSYVTMDRTDKGVYRATLKGDHENAAYVYWVYNSETVALCTDPYAKGSTQNGEQSVVINFKRLEGIDLHKEALPVLNQATDAIIYEAHVRDMTIDESTDIVHKGTFAGLAEKGRKTLKGNPAGFDYIKSLGITHLQLLPIYDYRTVDEKNPDASYNWGYDPWQYFVPEGSYASVLDDPLSRIVDLKKMVAAYHEEGIRIVMDVVFNHVYEYEGSVFERVVPNYYFRHRHNGTMANTSGCGNDLASERPMVRKLIVDACQFWAKTYGIDGFRFDLMGIIDVKTLTQIKDKVRAIDKSFILYGEGWNMGGEVKEPLGHMGNYKLLPDFGFFNDHYRETAKNYFTEDYSQMQPFKHAYASSSVNFIEGAKFLNANQSINYVECHDNATFFDFVSKRRSDLPLKDRLDIVKLANASILLSFGVPFIHAGQEIGATKYGEENTYNKGDHYNKFSYKLLDERIDMVNYFRDYAHFRKGLGALHLYDPRAIDESVDIRDVGTCIRVSFLNKDVIAPRRDLQFFINPSHATYKYVMDSPYEVILDKNGASSKEEASGVVEIPPVSVLVIEGK